MDRTLKLGEAFCARDTAKFGTLTGLCAIFTDAAIPQGLFWDGRRDARGGHRG